MKVIALSEGAFTIDKSKQFIPFNLEKDELNSRPLGSLLVEIQPFVVITKKDILILDTGLGFADDKGELQICKNLRENGISHQDVTKVLLSHLHKDHASGIRNKSGELTFENATYFVNRHELDNAMQNESLSYVKDELKFLQSSNRVVLIEDEGVIDNYIFYKVTGGHSIYHQVFWIKEDNETIFFGADVSPQLQQMKSRFVAKYDYDGKRSMELRREWLENGTKENWTFLFYHDIKNPIFKF